MPQRLRDLDAIEVSLVPRGANRKKFIITKSDEGGSEMEEVLKALLEAELEDEAKVDSVLKAAKLSDKAANAVKGALRLLNAYKDELPKDIVNTLAGLAGYGYPEPAAKQSGNEEKSKGKYGYPAPTKKEDGSWDFSGVAEELRPALEALWKEHEKLAKEKDELKKALDEERDKQRTREFVAKAAELAHLPVKPEEFGPVLKAIADKLSPEQYQAIEKVLRAADQDLANSALFKEFGSSRPSPGSAEAEIETLAKSRVEKSEGLTYEQAYARVIQERPDLYDRYLREQGGAR